VQVSAKTQYACIAILELARNHHSKEPVRIRTIAQEHDIPARFLVQILIHLRNAGLVQSTRGAAGGYRLARDPRSISLKEVMSAVDGGRDSKSMSASPASSPLALLIAAWEEAEAAQSQVLGQIHFGQLAERLKQRVGSDYTI
jgi:Rrf2 family transcriptional regulator, cysteine metabolism repressor